MAKNAVLVKLTGYPGDDLYFSAKEKLTALFPDAKMVGVKEVAYLSQKGFGPGYFNNSGRYAIHFKYTSANTAAEIKEAIAKLTWRGHVDFFDDADEYKKSVDVMKNHARRMNKQHPY